MNSFVLLLLVSLLVVSSNAFSSRAFGLKPRTSMKSKDLSLFAGAKNKVSSGEEKVYWEGDWVCADCGYIYDADIDDPKGEGRPFEEMVRGFICPQCSAPRKRYAKAVNGQWGVTNDGGDLPMYAMTFAGLAATTWFTLVVVPTL